jgi:hypothetical protein
MGIACFWLDEGGARSKTRQNALLHQPAISTGHDDFQGLHGF